MLDDENKANYKTSYTKVVLDYMREGHTLNRYEALQKFGITELNTVICLLRQRGHVIQGDWERGVNRFGRRVKMKRYTLVEEVSI